MATCRDIVSGALRKIGRLGAGREPRAADQNDGLAALQGLYRQWINCGAFGRITDVTPISDYVAGENERIFRNTSATLSITLPETVTVGDATLTPLDTAVIIISDAFTGITVEYIYDGHGKLWQPIDALALDDPAPLSVRDPEGLKACLAMQIADEFGAEVGTMTQRQAAIFTTALTHRYGFDATANVGIYV